MNLWILAAVFAQMVIAAAHPRAGAVFGILLSAGIAVWGAAVYADGGTITFLGMRLPGAAFAMLMLLWLRFDVARARRVFAATAGGGAIDGAAPMAHAPAGPATAVAAATPEGSPQVPPLPPETRGAAADGVRSARP